MSFQNYKQGQPKVQRPTPLPVTNEDAVSGGDVENEIKFLVADIAQFQKDVQNLRSNTKQIGSAKDSIALREKIEDEFNRTSSTIKVLTDKMKSINRDIYNIRDTNARKKQVTAYNKVKLDCDRVLKLYKSVCEQLKEKQTYNPSPMTATTEDLANADQNTNLLGSEFSQEVTLNTTLIEERTREIQKINQSVVEVNLAFQDLATMVQEQGEMIDSIEDNINRATDNTEKGVKNIVKAEETQKGTRKCCLYLLCVLIVGTGGVLLIYFLATKGK